MICFQKGRKLSMSLNPNYEAIGKAFTEQYYNMFDNPATR